MRLLNGNQDIRLFDIEQMADGYLHILVGHRQISTTRCRKERRSLFIGSTEPYAIESIFSTCAIIYLNMDIVSPPSFVEKYTTTLRMTMFKRACKLLSCIALEGYFFNHY